MTTDDTFAYLTRALARARQDGAADGRRRMAQVTADFAKGVAIGNSREFVYLEKAGIDALRESTSAMARLAFDATKGDRSEEVASAVQAAATGLQDDLAESFGNRLKQGVSVVGDAGARLVSFREAGAKVIEGIVDDFSHGIVNGESIAADPVVSVISSITNSPGAIQQAGIGNVQIGMTPERRKAMQDVLANFRNAEELRSLSSEQREDLLDLVDFLARELEAPNPRQERLVKWGGRLVQLAARFGVDLAASGLAVVLLA